MSTKELLSQLDSVSGSADKVRMHSQAANRLRAAIQHQEQADALDGKIAAHRDWSIQGEAQYASLRKRRDALPAAPLAAAMAHAESVLTEWQDCA